MGNRAYLYAANSVPEGDWTLPEGEYYDSRGTIPLAWWFLFSPADVHFADVSFNDSTSQRLRFVADRAAAIERIKSNRDLLNQATAHNLEQRHVDYFIAVLSEWQGERLLMDPDEILANEPQDDAAKISSFLAGLQQKQLDANALLDRVKEYSRIEPKARADVLIVGYTYGPIGQKLWDQRMRTEL